MRLFVALDFPEAVRASLRDLIARLRPLSSGARWARTEGMHITLKFIGETDRGKLEAISSALASVHSTRTVEMQFRGLGFFPSERKPRVLWCAVDASPNLDTLTADIESALEPAAIARETRTFVPHLTLARFDSQHGLKGVDKLASTAEELKSYEFGATRESEFYLYESALKPSGAEYKRLATFPFVQDSE